MIAGLWGRKVGMTQVFSAQKVVPVTVINADDWVVTDIKTQERDGYHAVQVGQKKKRFAEKVFSPEWLRKKKEYFGVVREIKLEKPVEGIEIGSSLPLETVVKQGDTIDILGVTKGHGFTGVVKRHGFGGGRASHGDVTGRRPGAIGSFRSRGKVMKNKRLPGHYGCEHQTVRNITVVSVVPEHKLILVKGAVPGKPGSLLFMRKQGE